MTDTVLVVDDEPDLEDLVRQKFRRQIRDGAFAFHFARDGVEERSGDMTAAPAAASRRAVAAPSPDPAPVTIATLPASLSLMPFSPFAAAS